MEIKKIENIVDVSENSVIIYQRRYKADVTLTSEKDRNISILFTIEMNPISFNYYINTIDYKNDSELEDESSLKKILISKIAEIHAEGVIDFEHGF